MEVKSVFTSSIDRVYHQFTGMRKDSIKMFMTTTKVRVLNFTTISPRSFVNNV